MDCRRSALLAMGLMSALLGCTPQRALPLIPTTPPTPVATPAVPVQPPSPTAEVTQTKRTPKAATCVALGQMREQDMESSDRTPAQREVLADHARKAYQQAIRLDSKHVPAYHALARLHIKLNQSELALETYQQAVKLAPEDAALWFELGMCCSRLRQWGPALKALQKACELAPDNRPYTQTYAYALARAGRCDDSLAVFQKVVNPARAHYNLARMLVHLEDRAQAQKHLILAVQMDANLSDAQQLLNALEGGKVPATAPDTLPDSESSATRRAPGLLTVEENELQGGPVK